MANTKNTEKTTKTVETKAPKTETVKKTESKKAEEKKVQTTEKKKVNTKAEEKKVETTEKKKVNRERKTLTMQEIVDMMNEAALNVYNAQAKGNYRIIGSKSGSSLNVQTQKYILFSTDADFDLVSSIKDKYQDLVFEKGANSQDKCRPNAIKFTDTKTLEGVIKLMAKTYKVAAK